MRHGALCGLPGRKQGRRGWLFEGCFEGFGKSGYGEGFLLWHVAEVIECRLCSGVAQGVGSEGLPGFEDLLTPWVGAARHTSQHGARYLPRHAVQALAGIVRAEVLVFVIIGGAQFSLANGSWQEMPPDFFQQAHFQAPGGGKIQASQQGTIQCGLPGERIPEGGKKLQHPHGAGAEFHGAQQRPHEEALESPMQLVAVAGIKAFVEAESPLAGHQRMAKPARQLARVIFDIAVMDRDHRRLVFRLSGQSQARAEPDIASFSRGRRGLARVLQDVFQSEDGGRV